MTTAQARAQAYLEHIDFEFTEAGMTPVLTEDAPDELLDLARRVAGGTGAGEMVVLFEALTTVCEAKDPLLCEVDEKVCGLDAYHRLVEELTRGG
ncbi:hypothetical protein [Desulfohalovibrio reitneri]|uniref:hypothetical protein n=1 Tax=Desulfohalovibrio reitneri TaxID=1307759 RepID=UPI0004A72D86|nr:hypothetical protein [Desulfohalovibrio reitneri]